MSRSVTIVLGVLAVVLVGAVLIAGVLVLSGMLPVGAETIEKTEYQQPPPDPWQELVDDRLEDKKPEFDPKLIDRRKLGDWLVNSSAAVVKLDVIAAKPDQDAALLTLHPSYAAAVQAAGKTHGEEVLPSVNLIDGKAKQFDDGLYAALDQAYYSGLEGKLRSHVALVKAVFEKAGPNSPAAPFLAAALELAGEKVAPDDTSTRDRLLQAFEANEVASKPIGFYTWNEKLKQCFRFLRFLQRPFGERDLETPVAVAQVLAADPALLADYRKAIDFYNKLTNPASCLSVADILDMKTPDAALLIRRCKERKVDDEAVALFPPSTSRENLLFRKLFGEGLPPNADLMRELIRAIRSGKVNLEPKKDSGWYERQVYALETLLLPEKGEESQKLLLTKAYKKRMLEAFQVLMTKRRETHVRQLKMEMAGAAAPHVVPDTIRPRLRLEPCPSYYVRTARAYAFLANFLESAVGAEGLKSLHGLKQDGQRQPDLHAELLGQRDLYYGLYLVTCEDVGLRPKLLAEEAVDEEHCYKLASDWLPKALDDADLAADTRVSVPIMIDVERRVTRLWVTLGVRLAKLDASYERPPSLKVAADKDAEWKEPEAWRVKTSHYLIPVEEFAEVELAGLRALTRDELRALCDREKTKEAIVAALRR
jgi:hypothetical protein